MRFLKKLTLTSVWCISIFLGCKEVSKQYALGQREAYNCQLEAAALNNQIIRDAVENMHKKPAEGQPRS